MADTKKVPSDAQLLARLRRSRGGRTAAQLNTTSQRLDALDGVVRVGKVHTGQRGRPAILFDVEEHAAEVAATPPRDQAGDDPNDAEQARSGELSKTDAS